MGTFLIFIFVQHIGIELDNYYILFFLFTPFILETKSHYTSLAGLEFAT